MERTVWKYTLSAVGNTFEMPIGAEILCVQMQDGEPKIWALVSPAAPTTKRTFEVYGTGGQINYGINTDRDYVGTFQLKNGLVFHLFELIVK